MLLRAPIAGVFWPMLFARVAGDEPCSCARVATLEAEVSELKSAVQRLETLITGAAARGAADADTMRVGVATDGRRLQMTSSAGKTLAAARAWQLHEFPSGHSCTSPGKAYLEPLMPAEGMTSDDVPTSPVAAFSLMSNVDGQSQSEIQRIPAPFKVVHAANCGTPPSLELPLDTVVTGSLTVSGNTTVASLDVSGSLTVNGAAVTGGGGGGGAMTWTNLQLNTGATDCNGKTPQYAVKDGVVYLRGFVCLANVQWGRFATLHTTDNRPSVERNGAVAGMPQQPNPLSYNVALRMMVDPNSGYFAVSGIGNDGGIYEMTHGSVYLDGFHYSL